jgi:hypothetical protein
MKKTLLLVSVSASIAISSVALAQQGNAYHPGLEPFTPTRIDWLSTQLEASLRTENLREDGFFMHVVQSGPETVTIYVRYLPTVNREAMNLMIDSARKVIAINAKSYGWDGWLKVNEDIKMQKKGGQ